MPPILPYLRYQLNAPKNRAERAQAIGSRWNINLWCHAEDDVVSWKRQRSIWVIARMCPAYGEVRRWRKDVLSVGHTVAWRVQGIESESEAVMKKREYILFAWNIDDGGNEISS